MSSKLFRCMYCGNPFDTQLERNDHEDVCVVPRKKIEDVERDIADQLHREAFPDERN